jgi:tRNA threonylcarbamoyl adenosine modification protein YjeE
MGEERAVGEERCVFFCFCGDEEETMVLGSEMGGWSVRGDVWLLEGDLGVGKTCFARGFIRGLVGESTVVPSPTFGLMQSYDGGGVKIYHYDLYRMAEGDSLYDLGWEEAMREGMTMVEWPQVLGVGKDLLSYWRVLWRGDEEEGRRIEVWRKGGFREEEGLLR